MKSFKSLLMACLMSISFTNVIKADGMSLFNRSNKWVSGTLDSLSKLSRPIIWATAFGLGYKANKNHLANLGNLSVINFLVGISTNVVTNAICVVGTYSAGALLAKIFKKDAKPKMAASF